MRDIVAGALGKDMPGGWFVVVVDSGSSFLEARKFKWGFCSARCP